MASRRRSEMLEMHIENKSAIREYKISRISGRKKIC